MRDIQLADTIYMGFSTRSFSTGAPTTLAGTPVVSAYEDAGLTQITAGISLSVDHDGVTGFHMLTIVATGANGFEDDKDYNLVITTGTVGGVSVVGEVVGQYSIQRTPVNWANVSNPTTAVDLSATDIQLVDTTTTNTDMRGTDSAALASAWTATRAGYVDELAAANIPADVDILLTRLSAARAVYLDNLSAGAVALASIATEARLAELDAANLPADIDTLLTRIAQTLNLTALGNIGVDWANVENPTTVLDLAATIIQLVDTCTTNTDMRGTDGANTTVPDAAGTAPTAVEIRQEMDSNSTQLNTTLPALIDDLAIKKNTAFPNFEFLMVLTSDHVTPATGLTVTGQRSINGGAFAGVTGSIAEVSNGIYQFDAVAADTNGDVITWRFSEATADDAFITFKTVA
jgi:hypothetical protein